jgi:hypothetical protein
MRRTKRNPNSVRSVAIAAAVNDRTVLAACLQSSPDIAGAQATLRIFEGFASAALAYSRALAETDADVVVLAHQDVYLPAGFLERLQDGLARLEELDPNWAVAGVIGQDERGAVVGETWSSGLRQLVGEKVLAPAKVVTLDEVLIIVRRGSGVAFDTEMPGFHLYAADLVQTARDQGHASYVLDLPIVHHSRPVVRLDAGYRRAYRYMQRKWRRSLPIPNLVCPVTRWGLPLLIRDLRLRRLNYGQNGRKAPSEDPAAVARRLGME